MFEEEGEENEFALDVATFPEIKESIGKNTKGEQGQWERVRKKQWKKVSRNGKDEVDGSKTMPDETGKNDIIFSPASQISITHRSAVRNDYDKGNSGLNGKTKDLMVLKHR